MADHSDGPADPAAGVALQRHVTALVLARIGPVGFALAGSGAIREHGITDRPTRDVDLFTTAETGPDDFAAAVETAETVLRLEGYRVARIRSTPEFARLLISTTGGTDETGGTEETDGGGVAEPGSGFVARMVVELDLGIDWRAEPPAQLAIGPVLALDDAVASKVAAVYSRGEVRDYLDLDAIRASERFTDNELTVLAAHHDRGFDTNVFIARLRDVAVFGPTETAEYGVSAEQLGEVKARLISWADDLATQISSAAVQTKALRPTEPPRPSPPADQRHPGPPRDDAGPTIGL